MCAAILCGRTLHVVENREIPIRVAGRMILGMRAVWLNRDETAPVYFLRQLCEHLHDRCNVKPTLRRSLVISLGVSRLLTRQLIELSGELVLVLSIIRASLPRRNCAMSEQAFRML